MKLAKKTLTILMVLVLLSGCGREEVPAATTEPTAAPTEAPTVTPTAPITGNLICVEISRFTGGFVEDGKDRPVRDVAAILVQNNTGKYLELAMITYKVGDRTAQFRVTALPAGRRAWVMESSAMTLVDGDELVLEECVDSYNLDAITTTDDISVSRNGKSLTLTNTSDKRLENVGVYYKNTLEDGTFLGGITYVISFGNLEPGASATRTADHFDETSEIVRYNYQ